MKLNFLPLLNSYVETQPLVFKDRVLKEEIKSKGDHGWGVLIQNDWCPYKSRNAEIDMLTGKAPSEYEGMDQGDASTCQGG